MTHHPDPCSVSVIEQDGHSLYIPALLAFTSRVAIGQRPGTVLRLNADGSIEVDWQAVQDAADTFPLPHRPNIGRGDIIAIMAHTLLAMRDGRVTAITTPPKETSDAT